MTSPIDPHGARLAIPHLSPGTSRQGRETGTPVRVAVFGSTGSVGTQALDVLEHLGDAYRVVCLVGHRNVDLLARQVERHRPALVGLSAPPEHLRDLLETARPELMSPDDAMTAAATDPDIDLILAATSGHTAIPSTLAALRAGKIVALANKETIVCAGPLVMDALAASPAAQLRPVDSEHSALWQSLGRSAGDDVARLILTASGGPFRTTPATKLARVDAAAALKHPTWAMGGKITIDSATLMNKGLEVIETHWLFGIPYDRIDVVVHPESIVHSLVEFADGSQVAQLGWPDMRLPIQYALTYPDHVARPARRLSLAEAGTLTFEEPDRDRFPALRLAEEAGRAGSTYPAVLSAADEVAVAAFMRGAVSFTGIAEVVAATLAAHRPSGPLTLEAIDEADRWARATAGAAIARRS